MPKINRAVIVDTSHSPSGMLKPVPVNNITLQNGFWYSRLTTNHQVTIPSQLSWLEKTGRLDNFRRVFGESSKPYQGFVFNDSDVYKWLEAAAWSLVYQDDDQARERIDQVLSLVIKAQDKDGYLNTYFSLEKIRERWMNLAEKHELYCAGHLIQAAIAHHRVIGNYRFLNVALRLADHICKTFGPSQVEGTSGHPEIEMALVELYRTTGEEKYLDQAALFLDRRGCGLVGGTEYLVDHAPFRKLERLAGHAVRALYLCCGATDLTLETGDEELRQTLERLWTVLVNQQMYITGGVGARHDGEALGLPFELPNARAYAESCAAIANVMWNWRMLQLDGTARYADMVEWALYNAVLPGISLDGNSYFYINPLKDGGLHRREQWFDCACCPPNIARTIAAFPGSIYSVSNKGIWVHQYTQSKAAIELFNGVQVKLDQATAYPWLGQVKIKITEVNPGRKDKRKNIHEEFTLFIRIPGWLAGQVAGVKLNRKPYNHQARPGTYLEIQRRWRAGDELELDFPMHGRFLLSHPNVDENLGRVAVAQGPILYCLEAVDNPDINLTGVKIDPAAPITSEFDPELLGGLTKLHLIGQTAPLDPGWEQNLYRPYHRADYRTRNRAIELLAIPYFLWANRAPGAMQIWHAAL